MSIENLFDSKTNRRSFLKSLLTTPIIFFGLDKALRADPLTNESTFSPVYRNSYLYYPTAEEKDIFLKKISARLEDEKYEIKIFEKSSSKSNEKATHFFLSRIQEGQVNEAGNKLNKDQIIKLTDCGIYSQFFLNQIKEITVWSQSLIYPSSEYFLDINFSKEPIEFQFFSNQLNRKPIQITGTGEEYQVHLDNLIEGGAWLNKFYLITRKIQDQKGSELIRYFYNSLKKELPSLPDLVDSITITGVIPRRVFPTTWSNIKK